MESCSEFNIFTVDLYRDNGLAMKEIARRRFSDMAVRGVASDSEKIPRLCWGSAAVRSCFQLEAFPLFQSGDLHWRLHFGLIVPVSAWSSSS